MGIFILVSLSSLPSARKTNFKVVYYCPTFSVVEQSTITGQMASILKVVAYVAYVVSVCSISSKYT